MIQSPKYFAVNWAMGMKIHYHHYLKQDKYIEDKYKDSNSLMLNSFNYGLLPTIYIHKDLTSIIKVESTATGGAELIIGHCEAVTAAGYRVSLSDYRLNITSFLPINKDLPEQNQQQEYYVAISVDPFKKEFFGDIDLDEIPVRHPFIKETYSVEIVAVSKLDDIRFIENRLVIGKIKINKDKALIDPNFIPSCATVSSHPDLLVYYNKFLVLLKNFQDKAFNILQKCQDKNTKAPITLSVKTFCQALMDYLIQIHFSYVNIIKDSAPIFLIEIFSTLALNLYATINIMPVAEKEKLLNYIFSWSQITPSVFLNQLDVVATIKYNHLNCGNNFNDIDQLLKNLEIILKNLSKLDYIGQEKENIVIREEDITPEPKNITGWTLLD